MDKPGKDSWRHKKAGAVVSVISSATKIGLVMDTDHDHDPKELIRLFPPVNIILAEGFKNRSHLKLEIFRPETTANKIPLCANDSTLLALITDTRVLPSVPNFGLEDFDEVAKFLIQCLKL
jgi:molybdopterin-guanine dinucleotide biosynthesis protein B